MYVEFFYLMEIMVIHVSGKEDIGSRPEICHDGYMGVICEKRCPFPYYGDQCIRKCKCRKELCNFVTGCPPPADTCPVGFIGPYCETSCTYPNYGNGCQLRCHCSKLRCNSITDCGFIGNPKNAGLNIRKDNIRAECFIECPAGILYKDGDTQHGDIQHKKDTWLYTRYHA